MIQAKLSIVICLPVIFLSCQQQPDIVDNNPVIAKVHKFELRSDELQDVISDAVSTQDSIAMANAYIENWLREMIWIEEAENKMGSDAELESLVDAYRASLIKLQYENRIIEEKLDSVINDNEYITTYDKYKSQFTLDDQLIRCWIVKVPRATNGISQFYKDFKKSELESVTQYSRLYAELHYFDDPSWLTLNELKNIVPEEVISTAEIRQKANFRKKQGDDYYFLKFIDYKDKNDFPPLEYIKDELKRLILHRRKQKIIADLTEQMYEDKLKNNQIQVFSNPS